MNAPCWILTCLTGFGFLMPSPVAAFLQDNETGATGQPSSPWVLLETGSDASIRGLHVVSDQILWASGTGGTVLRSTDRGQTFEKHLVPGAQELDFRDIHAFDDQSAVIMSSGSPARIYRTEDGGTNWKMVFEHASEKAFFDAISFWDAKRGIVMSDPVDDRVLLIVTDDGGLSWEEPVPERRPVVIPGEGGFAASGTNMVLLPNGNCLIALGAAKPDENFPNSRLARSTDRARTWSFSEIPITRNASSGVFSMAFANDRLGVAVGGDYLKPDLSERNIAVTQDGGKTWSRPVGRRPRGYRSGVAAQVLGDSITFIAVGTSGTDLSDDQGVNWRAVSDEPFHAIQFSPSGKSGFASGGDGRIARWK